MASPTVQTTNEENVPLPKQPTKMQSTAPQRRVLGDVSPNVKLMSQTSAFLSKPLAGSPLKRSFTAAVERGDGLTYLKRRKLSENELLSQSGDQDVCNSRSSMVTGMESFRPVFPSAMDHSVRLDIPTITPPEPSPTEPNTPTEEESSTQSSSADRKSFSSLINYDLSSQTSTSIFKVLSNAEMLKLRLRIAMYKVRTGQVEVPFPELRVDTRPQSIIDSTAAANEAVEQLRKEAREVAARDKNASPGLLPAPVLRPTAYSSRMTYDNQLPSSPPVRSPIRLPAALFSGSASTPMRSQEETCSVSSSYERLEMDGERELTSSVVKGRVAEGLLGLRNAV